MKYTGLAAMGLMGCALALPAAQSSVSFPGQPQSSGLPISSSFPSPSSTGLPPLSSDNVDKRQLPLPSVLPSVPLLGGSNGLLPTGFPAGLPLPSGIPLPGGSAAKSQFPYPSGPTSSRSTPSGFASSTRPVSSGTPLPTPRA